MDSDDFSLIDIGHEDDSLLRNLPPDEAGGFPCSPLVIAASAASSRPPKTTILKDSVRFGETGCVLPDSNKENLKVSCNMKLGSSNLSLEPQKMKRNRKAGGCSLRKSLAWDKAFFTEEGVLSSLELSMISGTPSKLDGKYLPVISEEQRTPMHANATPTGLQTMKSKSSRKLPFSSTKEDKRTGEGSILKQKSLASGLAKSKKLASTASAKNSDRKEGSCLIYPTPTSHKRLLSTSPAKPAAQNSKIPRMPVLKSDAHLSSTTASSSDASHLKRNRIAPPATSIQKHIDQIGCSNTRSTSNSPKIVSLRIPKPSKPSDQRTRKNRNVPSSREHPSTSHKVSHVKEITSSEANSGKIYPIGLEANEGTSKAAVSVRVNSGNTCIIGQSAPHQAAKPSGLKMPSPSLRFFSEPKISMSTGLGQRNIQLGATCNVFQSKIPKTTMDRIPDSGPAQQCSVSSISHNLGSRWNIIQSKISKAAMDRTSDSISAQPCSVSSMNSPKIHDESVQCKNNELIIGAQALLDEKPLEQMANNGVEEFDKHFVEHEHTSVSIEGVDGKDNTSVSPNGECKYNDKDLSQSFDYQLTSGMEKNSDCHVEQQQCDLSAMNNRLVPESEAREYSIVHTPLVCDSSLEMPNRIDRIKDQELQCPSYVTDEVSQIYDGLSSNTKELLKRSFSPGRAFEIDSVDHIMEEAKVDKQLVASEALSALEKIVDTANMQQELEVLQCLLPLMDKPVEIFDKSIAENDAFRIVTDDDKKSEPLALEVAPSASLDTKPHTEDHVDLSVAEYTNETDLNGQDADLKLQMSPRVSKSVSHVDAVICDAEFSFSPASLNTKPQADDHVDLSVAEYAHETDLIGQNVDLKLQISPKVSKSVSHVDAVICDAELSCSPTFLDTKPRTEDHVDLSAVEYAHETDLIGQNPDFQLQKSPRACKSTSQVDAVKCDVELSLDTKLQVEDHVDLSVAECTNETDSIDQNADFELQVSPRACKSISQIDAVVCDVELSFSPFQGLGSAATELSTYGIDQQHTTSDEIVREPLMPDKATSASLKSKLSSNDLVTFENIKLRHRAEFQLSSSTISVKPLMPDEAISGFLENEHSEDLVSIDDRELSYQAEFQLSPCTIEDQTIRAAAVCTPSLGNETMSVFLGKDMCEEDLVVSDCREEIALDHMEKLLLANKNENQTANSPAINNTEAYSLHGSVDLPSRVSTIIVYKLENDYQMNQEPPHTSLEIEQVENHIIFIDDSSSRNNRSDQTILQELQLSPRMSEDCNLSSAANCDILASSSPSKIYSTAVRKASAVESDEQFESANVHEDIHDIDNEDENTRSRIVKGGKNPSQLVIRPPADVIPFSEEWLAAVEAAGEEILTLKTGPVQNSPPAKLSPEPSPWSPVKRKNNQGIGPYDCTKFTGQH